MSGHGASFEDFLQDGHAHACAQDLVRELNALREAAVGVAPEYRLVAPAGIRLDKLRDNMPPSWLCCTDNVEPASDEVLWQLLTEFARRWTAREAKERMRLLRMVGTSLRGFLRQPVRIGPRAAGSMIEGIADAAEEIACRTNLSGAAHVAELRELIEHELTHFEPGEAYISAEGEICAASDKCSSKKAAASALDSEPSIDKVDSATLEEEALHLKVEGNNFLNVVRSLLEKLGGAGSVPTTPLPRLRIEGDIVLLDGAHVPLGLTEESRTAALCLLRHLLAAAGEWRSSTELDAMEGATESRCRDHVGIRWDRVRKRLPDCLRSLIESHPRKGYRLQP